MADPLDQNRGTPTELLAAGRQLALKEDVWSVSSVQEIVDQIHNLFDLDIPNWQEVLANFADLQAAFSGEYTGDDPALLMIQNIIQSISDAISVLGNNVNDVLAWLRSLIEKLTGRVRTSIHDAIQDAVEFSNQLKTLLTGGQVTTPLSTLTSAVAVDQTQVNGLAVSLNTLHGNVDAVIDGIFQGAANASGAVGKTLEQARDALLGLFGVADNAEKIAIAAQQQIQDLANTQIPGGVTWSTTFGGADGDPLPSADWVDTGRLFIRGDSGEVGIGSGLAVGSYSRATVRELATDTQSASAVLGYATTQGKKYDTMLALRCNSDGSQGAYCAFGNGRISLGKFVRSGSTYTFTQIASQAATFSTGSLVKFKCWGDNYYVQINGTTVLSITDSGAIISKGAAYRRCLMLETRGQILGFLDDSYRIASFAMADWLPAGASVTVPSWRLRKGTASMIDLSVSAGANNAALPDGFFTVNDQAVGVTVSSLGVGQITIAESNWYEIGMTALVRVNTNTSAGNEVGFVACHWGLFVNGTLVSGPIASGVGHTLYLGAGDVISPRIIPATSLNLANTNAGNTGATLAQLGVATSPIADVNQVGGPTACFYGRKVS